MVGVDDFSQFDRDGENLAKIGKCQEESSIKNFEFFDSDFEYFLNDDLAGLKGSVGIYFFDASHDYRSQILALMHAPAWLAEGGMIVVDDCNYPHVRQASVDFLRTHPDYKLISEFYTGRHPNYRAPTPSRLSGRLMRRLRRPRPVAPDHAHMRRCRETWWNDVNIIVHDSENRLEPMLPHVPESLRAGFIAQHGFAGCDAEGTSNRIAADR